jgi:hypothetical protein
MGRLALYLWLEGMFDYADLHFLTQVQQFSLGPKAQMAIKA